MAFVKLDTGILNSTLWVERECREVFITALLMAMPREFNHELPQISVRSLELTGFVAPPGWYGFVEAAGVGIVRRAMVDMESGMVALEKLCDPDPESRSKEFDGRRMIRVDGGYLVLNFMKYRDRDHTAAERARRYRDRKMASRRDIITSHRDITQAEAEAEAYKTPPTPPQAVGRFAEFWKAYPAGVRKVAKAQCEKKWKSAGCELIADRILSALLVFKSSAEWLKDGGAFVPAPLGWLNQARWEAVESMPDRAAEVDAEMEAREKAERAWKNRTPEQIEAANRARLAAVSAIKRVG